MSNIYTYHFDIVDPWIEREWIGDSIGHAETLVEYGELQTTHRDDREDRWIDEPCAYKNVDVRTIGCSHIELQYFHLFQSTTTYLLYASSNRTRVS